MLMIAGNSPVPATNYETAIALRSMALLQPYLPKYLLAPEMQQAIDRAREEGIEFALPAINPKTLRHSFAMHLFFNHVPPKVVQAYIGHERYESTEVYLKVFALDVASQLGVTFSLAHRDYSHLLTRR
ncbi:TPA: tyrosine-type recombinase/integrase [Escherichia coli]|nr:tyrosine-type recombinase/integrase [Escherichia coli]HCQ8899801.1 tyrosine-type recombinase/integrase [Escherichia coli]HCQ9034694.1 tyrosine-type recombinase/integrase [Escherichia coli]